MKFNWKKKQGVFRKRSLLMSMLNAALWSSLINTTVLTFVLLALWSNEVGSTLSGMSVAISIAVGLFGMAAGFIITLPLLLILYFIMRFLLKRGKTGVIYWILCSAIVVFPFVSFPIELKNKMEIIENPIVAYLSMLLLPTSLLTGFLSWFLLRPTIYQSTSS